MQEMAKRYRARDGAPYSDAQAQIVGEELDGLAQRVGGGVTAASVVDVARPPNSRLHGYFEWNDAHAGEQWRREQARHLVRSIEIQVEVRTPDGAVRNWFRAFAVVTLEGSPSGAESFRRTMKYVPIETVVSERRLVDQLVAEAERDLRSWARRYESYRRFAEFEQYGVIFDLID